MLLQILKGLKHQLKLKVTPSVNKTDEFDPRVYNAKQFDRPKEPYYALAEIADKLLKPKSVIDVGCANGFTIEWWLKHGIKADGIEGAKAAFKLMPAAVRRRVKLWDLRKPLPLGKSYNLVLFTEVAEHIKPKYENVMLKSVVGLVEKYLLISWSDKWDDFKGTKRQEHFNPRPKAYVKKRLTALGLKFEPRLTEQLNLNLKETAAYQHWKNNLLIFKR